MITGGLSAATIVICRTALCRSPDPGTPSAVLSLALGAAQLRSRPPSQSCPKGMPEHQAFGQAMLERGEGLKLQAINKETAPSHTAEPKYNLNKTNGWGAGADEQGLLLPSP